MWKKADYKDNTVEYEEDSVLGLEGTEIDMVFVRLEASKFWRISLRKIRNTAKLGIER